MSNYYIVGGDGRQYGPITDTEVRKWATEGRLNEHTQARSENDTEWRTLSAFPEFTDIFGFAPAPDAPPVESLAAINLADHDYELDLIGTITRGWEMLKNNFGVLFVGPLIYFLIEMFIGGLGNIPVIGKAFSLINLILIGPLMAGVFYQFILVNRGQSTPVGDIFTGFRRRLIHLVLAHLTITFFTLLCFVPVIFIGGLKFIGALHQLQAAGSDQSAAGEAAKNLFAMVLTLLPWVLVCSLPVIYLTVSFIFTLPLIIDQDMDFWPALMTSRRMVGKHWWQVFGLTVLVGLLNLAGLMACCVGFLVAVPIGYGALMSAYETIFRPPAKS